MKISPLVFGALLVSPYLLAQTAPLQPAPSQPVVILLGTAHELHFKPESHYSLADLQNELEALHPDLICGEIAPEAYQGPMEGYFPPEAAYVAEIASQLQARFAPTDWRIAKAWQSRAEQMEPKEIKDKIDALTKEEAERFSHRLILHSSIFSIQRTWPLPIISSNNWQGKTRCLTSP